jgi:thiosulfate/3-mercaptopyruvate sulfurtransferase
LGHECTRMHTNNEKAGPSESLVNECVLFSQANISGFQRCIFSSVKLIFLIVLVATLCLSEDASTVWRQSELIEPSVLAKALDGSDPPYVVCVSEAPAYRTRHIAHAIFAGPGDKPEGIELLKSAASVLSKDESIVIYCGCCPLNKCPNVRPAYAALKELGFTKVRVLDLMTDIEREWYRQGYPSENGGK